MGQGSALPAGTETPYGPLTDGRLRVLTWNLWWQFGPWEARQPAISATIERLAPDVICLQETWADAVSGLAKLLGYESAFASRLDLAEGVGFGNAILSRWPVLGHETLPLPAPPEIDERRVCLRVDIDSPTSPLQLFTTHLNWRFDQSDIRQEQVRAICHFVADSPPRSYPPILCGDFNAEPDSDEIRLLTGKTTVPVPKLVFRDAWDAAHAEDGLRNSPTGNTWSDDNPFARLDLEYGRRIDYVFTGWPKAGGRGQVLGCEVVGAEPVDGVWPSDHYGVLATLRL